MNTQQKDFWRNFTFKRCLVFTLFIFSLTLTVMLLFYALSKRLPFQNYLPAKNC